MEVDQPPPPPKVEEVTSRNLIILENFEDTTPAERAQSETSVLFHGKKPPKLTSKTPTYLPTYLDRQIH